MKKIIEALAFSAEKHRYQRRKDLVASPYINHPIALLNVLVNEADVTDEATLVGALLHDTLEDTDTSTEELHQKFGPEIAGIVFEVTDDKSLEKDKRKEEQIRHARHLTPKARLIKLADKICNLRDILSSPPAHWSDRRKLEYFLWSEKVINALRGYYPRLERIFDELVIQGKRKFQQPIINGKYQVFVMDMFNYGETWTHGEYGTAEEAIAQAIKIIIRSFEKTGKEGFEEWMRFGEDAGILSLGDAPEIKFSGIEFVKKYCEVSD